MKSQETTKQRIALIEKRDEHQKRIRQQCAVITQRIHELLGERRALTNSMNAHAAPTPNLIKCGKYWLDPEVYHEFFCLIGLGDVRLEKLLDLAPITEAQAMSVWKMPKYDKRENSTVTDEQQYAGEIDNLVGAINDWAAAP